MGKGKSKGKKSDGIRVKTVLKQARLQKKLSRDFGEGRAAILMMRYVYGHP